MRYLYIIFLLSLPFFMGATTRSVPDTTLVSHLSFVDNQGYGEGGFLKKFIEKRLLKRLAKAEKSLGKSSDGDGKWLAISGLAVGILGILSWFINPYLGLIVSIPLGLLGILLCIISLKKARNSYDTGVVKVIAIAGIVINGLLAVGLLLAITLFSS